MRTYSPEQRRARISELQEAIRRTLGEIQSSDLDWLMGCILQQQRLSGETIPEAMERFWKSRYVRMPVSVRELVTGKRYLNLPIGQSGVYPKIMEALEHLFDGPYSDVVLAGSIGWGKSTLGTLAVCYDLYKVSCLRDPATTYGMKTGSNITFVNVSVDKRQAQRVFFTDLYNLIKSSWYFNNREELIVADLDLSEIDQAVMTLDVSGHYARPDVFQFRVNSPKRDQSCQ